MASRELHGEGPGDWTSRDDQAPEGSRVDTRGSLSMGKPSGCEQYGLIGAKRLSQKAGSRHYRVPAMSEALLASTPCY